MGCGSRCAIQMVLLLHLNHHPFSITEPPALHYGAMTCAHTAPSRHTHLLLDRVQLLCQRSLVCALHLQGQVGAGVAHGAQLSSPPRAPCLPPSPTACLEEAGEPTHDVCSRAGQAKGAGLNLHRKGCMLHAGRCARPMRVSKPHSPASLPNPALTVSSCSFLTCSDFTSDSEACGALGREVGV